MKKENQETESNILIRLAHLLGTEVKNRRLEIPEKFGRGYCSGFVFNEHIRMLVSNYVLNEDMVVENPDIDVSKRMIFFKFQNIFPKTEILKASKQLEAIPSVLIGTSRVNTDDIISIHTNTATINIEVDADYLRGIFDLSEKSLILQSLLQNMQLLLFEQVIYPSLRKIVDEIVNESIDETFKLFFLRIKSEELICRLLMELEKRDEKHLYALNGHDVQIIYKVKEKMFDIWGFLPLLENWQKELI